MRVPEAVLFDMDNRCFELRKAGLSYQQIGKALDCSTGRAWNGVKRAMDRISTKLAEDNREIHQMELERLDALFQHLWPLTMPRDVQKEDGSGSIRVPPSMDAVDRCLKIMDRRAKLLGLDTQVAQISIGPGGRNAEVTIGGAAKKDMGEITPQEEAKRLLRLFRETGVINAAAITRISEETGLDIVDAEIVEDGSTRGHLALEAGDDSEPFFPSFDEESGGSPEG